MVLIEWGEVTRLWCSTQSRIRALTPPAATRPFIETLTDPPLGQPNTKNSLRLQIHRSSSYISDDLFFITWVSYKILLLQEKTFWKFREKRRQYTSYRTISWSEHSGLNNCRFFVQVALSGGIRSEKSCKTVKILTFNIWNLVDPEYGFKINVKHVSFLKQMSKMKIMLS